MQARIQTWCTGAQAPRYILITTFSFVQFQFETASSENKNWNPRKTLAFKTTQQVFITIAASLYGEKRKSFAVLVPWWCRKPLVVFLRLIDFWLICGSSGSYFWLKSNLGTSSDSLSRLFCVFDSCLICGYSACFLWLQAKRGTS